VSAIRRTFTADLPGHVDSPVLIRGWIFRIRVLARTTFIIVRDGSGQVQCVAPTGLVHDLRAKVDDAIEVRGAVRRDDIFRVQAAILKHFRDYLSSQRFTEIVSSKIVASGTEGGTNLFEINYFDRVAYLAQSPQF
jgi:nondiscriminating aspartyl-tRNA synthetase